MLADELRRSRVVWLGALLLVGCASSDEPDSLPEARDWVVGDAEAAGFDPEALDELAEDIEAGEFPNTHAVLVEHDGVLVYERYFSGPDERWGDAIPARVMGPDSLHDLRSISKSVTSALLGIALADDFDAALARPVAEYLPELDVGEEQREITLHHMLTMTAGLEWNEMTVPYTDSTNDELRLYGAADPAAAVLSRPIAHPPGGTWYYSGGSTQVLATIISRLTGQTIDDFARERLFAPLGIQNFEWLGPGGWTPDNPAAMSGLRLTARDLAKLGSVYLNGGRWGGRQIVPEDWVSRSSRRHVPEIGEWSDEGVWGYGYQWWVGDLPSGQRVLAGVGNGNQRLFVVPGERLVVTVFAGQYNAFEPHSERILDRVLAARR
jgi:CubicO group peptidase (beta-lactamase class C family)